MTGYLSITFGPMFSEKTSQLIENIRNKHVIKTIKGEKIRGLVINHVSDSRDITQVENLTTHNKIFGSNPFPEGIDFVSTKNLSDIDTKGYDYIAIDESQFFEDIVPFVENMLSQGKYIHCVGLIADSDQKPMGDLWKLIPIADEVTQRKAYCVMCKGLYKNAPFTKYIGDTKKEGQVYIGANQDYIPVCRVHLSHQST